MSADGTLVYATKTVSQNAAWLRQITAANRLYIHDSVGAQIGVVDDDWVWLRSHLGRVKCQVRLMEGVNPHTVWTWNAIGKRKGAWALDPDAPEATRGFLLNHLIHELLPERGDGMRWANSDPVTGQAAWFDLRVKIDKATAPQEAQPAFTPIKSPVGQGHALGCMRLRIIDGARGLVEHELGCLDSMGKKALVFEVAWNESGTMLAMLCFCEEVSEEGHGTGLAGAAFATKCCAC